MRKILTSLFIVSSFAFVYSQGTTPEKVITNNEKQVIQKISRSSVHSSEDQISSKKQIDKEALNSSSKLATKTNYIKPATKINSSTQKSTISVVTNKDDSNLNNLLNLIEEKQNVNKYGSDKLKKSQDYNTLNEDITHYKAKFNSEINQKGFSNCTPREQNYFLSFLKEEGKETEYKRYASQIK